MIDKKNNSKKIDYTKGKAFSAAMDAYSKALAPMTVGDFKEEIERLRGEQIEAAKAAAELKAPESYEDRQAYYDYCQDKLDLVMKEMSCVSDIYDLMSNYYGGEI